jgi:uncharacterized membrane protein
MAGKTIRKFVDAEFLVLIAASFLCSVISFTRVFLSGSDMFLFLNWNLFLAFIPYVISRALFEKRPLKKRPLFAIVGFCTWLAFFPNAPYIITDISHLKHSDARFLWFDILMIFLFAWIGLIYGILSLSYIESTFLKPLKSGKLHYILLSALLFIGSYGIYLGRFLRWNSWDILGNPLSLSRDIFNTMIHPLRFFEAWAMTIFFGLILMGTYLTFRLVKINSPYFLERSD